MSVDFAKYCIDRIKPTDNERWLFCFEVDGFCPLCGKRLYNIKKQIRLTCEIAHIMPCNPTPVEKALLKDVPVLGENSEDSLNKIALCKDCHDNYDYHKTIEEYMTLYNIKRHLSSSIDAKTKLSEQTIEQELYFAVKQLSSLTAQDAESLEKLNYQALHVREKIPQDYHYLIKSIEDDVVQYFTYIQGLFKAFNQVNDNFEAIEMNIRHSYIMLKNKCNEEEIFEQLCYWIKNKTKGTRYVCQILTSFFVQNCDIYDKVSE